MIPEDETIPIENDEGVVKSDNSFNLESMASKYKVGDILATGGMGAVLKAKDVNCRRTVAMKQILNQHVSDPDSLTRFIEEAQVTAQLEHPNIVPVYELGIDESGNPFYTMKMVGGRTLKDIISEIKDGKEETVKEFSLIRLLNIFLRVCDAIAYAHSKGVIHRDMKPENIMVGDFGEVQVMDWGIAKIMDSKNSMDSKSAAGAFDIDSLRFDETDGLQTQYGKILGTPVYMSPEQAYGKIDELDGQTDVYALGGILYNILTLNKPVKGSSAQQILIKVISGEIEAPTVYNRMAQGDSTEAALIHCPEKKIPSSLSAVTMKALALEKSERYKNVEELQSEIEAYLNGFATDAEQAGPLKQFWLLLMRHKGISLTSLAAILIILTLTSLFIVKIKKESLEALRQKEIAIDQKSRAEENEKLAEKKTKELLEVSQNAAPRFINDAKDEIAHTRWSNAQKTIGIAIGLDPKNAEGWYQKGRILLAQQDFKNAHQCYLRSSELGNEQGTVVSKILQKYVSKLNGKNSGLSTSEKLNLVNELAPVNDLLILASIRANSDKSINALKNRLKGIVSYYADQGTKMNFSIYSGGKLNVTLEMAQSLKPLRGLPINFLTIYKSKNIDSLKPLQGIALESLTYKDGNYKLKDLSGLENSNLRYLNLYDCRLLENVKALRTQNIKDLILYSARNLKSLEGLENSKVETLDLSNCSSLTSISLLKQFPLKKLSIEGCSSLKNLDGLQNYKTEKLKLFKCSSLESFDGLQNSGIKSLDTYGVTKLKSLEGLQGNVLNYLELNNNKYLTDISTLKGMPLKTLILKNCPSISSLKALKGMPLENFHLSINQSSKSSLHNKTLNSLDGFQGTLLKSLTIEGYSGFKNFAPLNGLPMKKLNIQHCEGIQDFSGLENGKLEFVEIKLADGNKSLVSLKGLEGNPIKKLKLYKLPSGVKDLSPLKNLPIEELSLSNHLRTFDLKFLQELQYLKKFNRESDNSILTHYLSKFNDDLPYSGLQECQKLIEDFKGIKNFENLIHSAKKLEINFKSLTRYKNHLQGVIESTKEFKGKHYFLYPKTVKGDSISWRAHRLGAYPVAVSSKDELNFLINSFPKNIPIWLGGTTIKNQDKWKWLNGEEWNADLIGKIAHTPSSGLVLYQESLHARDIGSTHTFLIEWEPKVFNLLKNQFKAILEVKKNGKLSDKAVKFRDKKYFLYPQVMNWSDASDFCKKHGAHLADVNTKEEYEFIKSYICGLESWLGGVRNQGKWKWITNEEWNMDKWSVNYSIKKENHNYLSLSWEKSLYINFPDNYKRMFLMEWNE